MKIAFVIPYVPNQIRTRSYNLINHLAGLGHEVTLFTLGSNDGDFSDAEHMRTVCKDVHYHLQPTWRSLLNCVMALPSRKPLQSVYSWNPVLVAQLKAIIQAGNGKVFDIVHVEHLRGSEYGVFLKSTFPSLPVVWDSVDCISYLFEQASRQSGSSFGKLITRFELGRTRRAEGDLTSSFARVLVTSATDSKALTALVPAGREPASIIVLPNGVDLNYFKPNTAIEREPATLVFSGKMSYHANISMAKYLVDDVMPGIWAYRPETRLVIVGKDPPSKIKALANDPRITVTGTVSDIRRYLWASTMAVVPLVYGAGIQNKILEAMATGTPVITTSKAISALRAHPGKDILVADTLNDFSSKILQLMEHDTYRADIADAGLQYVRHHHDWTTIAGQLLDGYQDLISSTSKEPL